MTRPISHFRIEIIFLAVLMLVVSLADLYKKRGEATKFREYGFILLTGALGAAIGSMNDLITSSISPEYFTLGKGLDEGPDLRLQAGLFGTPRWVSGKPSLEAQFVCLRAGENQPSRRFDFRGYSNCCGCLSPGRFTAELPCRWGFPNFDPAKFCRTN